MMRTQSLVLATTTSEPGCERLAATTFSEIDDHLQTLPRSTPPLPLSVFSSTPASFLFLHESHFTNNYTSIRIFVAIIPTSYLSHHKVS